MSSGVLHGKNKCNHRHHHSKLGKAPLTGLSGAVQYVMLLIYTLLSRLFRYIGLILS